MQKILVIEDDDLGRELYRVMLERKGFVVVEASDGEEGLALYDDSFDLVITDIIMDNIDGFEVIETLRGRSPSVRILAITGCKTIGTLDTLTLARKYGADGILAKPINWKVMISTICDLLVAANPFPQEEMWSNHSGLMAALQVFIEESRNKKPLPGEAEATAYLLGKGFPESHVQSFVDVVYQRALDYFKGEAQGVS